MSLSKDLCASAASVSSYGSSSAASATEFDISAFLAAFSQQGPKAENQDTHVRKRSNSQRVCLAAVFDGHNEHHGLVVSTHCKNAVEQFFHTHEHIFDTWNSDEWVRQLNILFPEIHESLRTKFVTEGVQEHGLTRQCYSDEFGVVRYTDGYNAGNSVHGGSTGTIVVYADNVHGERFLVTANVGDSDAIAISDTTFSHLSEDHGAESQKEWERINVTDAHLYPTKLQFVYSGRRNHSVFLPDGTRDPRFVVDPSHTDQYGVPLAAEVDRMSRLYGLAPSNLRYEFGSRASTPSNIANKNDETSLAPTRGFGDFYANQFGFSCMPSINVTRLPSPFGFDACGSAGLVGSAAEATAHDDPMAAHDDPMDSSAADYPNLVVFGSDGIWDCWPYAEFADQIRQEISELTHGVSLQPLVESTVARNLTKAIATFGSRGYDDMTLIVFRLPEPLAPLAPPAPLAPLAPLAPPAITKSERTDSEEA